MFPLYLIEILNTYFAGYLFCMATDVRCLPQSQMWVNCTRCTGNKLNSCFSGLFGSQNMLGGNPSRREAFFFKAPPVFNYSFHTSFASTLAGLNVNHWVILRSRCFAEASAKPLKHTRSIQADDADDSQGTETSSSSHLAHNLPSPPGFFSVSHCGEWESRTTTIGL